MLFRSLVPAAFAAILALPACSLTTDTGYPIEETCAVGFMAAVRTELYFGLSRTGGPDVTEEEWQAFIDAEVTPRFPEGLTMVSADGQYLAESGEVLSEGSKILILVHEGGPQASADIDAIRQAYIEQFDQTSVLRVDSDACVSF